MTAPPKPIILIPLLCGVAGLGVVITSGRTTLFVPHAWLSATLPLVWLGVSVLTISAIALRMYFIRDPQNTFSKNTLLFVCVSLMLGFIAQEVALGATSLLNRFGAEQRTQCFVLVALEANPSGNLQRVMNADIRLPGDDAKGTHYLQYAVGSADLSQLKAGDSLQLQVLKGAFGYTALRGQRPGAGCSGQAPAR